jgi:hypothetical protein
MQRIVSVDSVRIKKFTVTPALYHESLRVALEWTTQNADHCTLNPGNLRLEANSSKPMMLQPMKGQPGYELTAWKGTRSSIPRVVLLMQHPFPPEFPPPPFSLELYPMEPIIGKTYGYGWADAFTGGSEWRLDGPTHYDSNTNSVYGPTGGIILKGKGTGANVISYFALSARRKNEHEWDRINVDPASARIYAWTGSEWKEGELRPINANGYFWYRAEIHMKASPNEQLISVYRPDGPFNMWGFRGK